MSWKEFITLDHRCSSVKLIYTWVKAFFVHVQLHVPDIWTWDLCTSYMHTITTAPGLLWPVMINTGRGWLFFRSWSGIHYMDPIQCKLDSLFLTSVRIRWLTFTTVSIATGSLCCRGKYHNAFLFQSYSWVFGVLVKFSQNIFKVGNAKRVINKWIPENRCTPSGIMKQRLVYQLLTYYYYYPTGWVENNYCCEASWL